MIALPPLLSQASTFSSLDPPMRAVLLMSLFAFLVLGFGLVLGAMLGGRWARRYGGDDLHEPLTLHKPEGPADAREPAMLRNASWGLAEGETKLGDGASETRAG